MHRVINRVSTASVKQAPKGLRRMSTSEVEQNNATETSFIKQYKGPHYTQAKLRDFQNKVNLNTRSWRNVEMRRALFPPEEGFPKFGPIPREELPIDLSKPKLQSLHKLAQHLKYKGGAVYRPIQIPNPLKYTQPKDWDHSKRRVGALCLKAGMTMDTDKWGVRHPLTVLKMEDVIVIGRKTRQTHGYHALIVGAYIPAVTKKNVNGDAVTRAATGDVPVRKHICEFRVHKDAMLPIGTVITAHHFVPGQKVKISGMTQGKGFQGAMKRWHFSGNFASHGNSVSHRALGSTGQAQDPGRIIRGKKMAGHMGNKRRTHDGAVVYKIDIKHNLIYIRGEVPSRPGGYVEIADSYFSAHKNPPPPFPTYTLSDEERLQLAKWANNAYLSPMDVALLEQEGKLPENYEHEPPFEYVVASSDVDPFAVPSSSEDGYF